MTPEELNRTIEFIVQSQARLAAAQEQDRQDRIQFEEWAKELFARMERTDKMLAERNTILEETQRTLAESQRTLAESQRTSQQTWTETRKIMAQTDSRLARLMADQGQLLGLQSERMDRIDKLYEDGLRQNAAFQSQALHLLNLILDRLPLPPPRLN